MFDILLTFIFVVVVILERIQAFEDDADSRMGLSHFPTMEDLLKMRQKRKVYRWFCRHFILCMVGATIWMDNCRQYPMHVLLQSAMRRLP